MTRWPCRSEPGRFPRRWLAGLGPVGTLARATRRRQVKRPHRSERGRPQRRSRSMPSFRGPGWQQGPVLQGSIPSFWRARWRSGPGAPRSCCHHGPRQLTEAKARYGGWLRGCPITERGRRLLVGRLLALFMICGPLVCRAIEYRLATHCRCYPRCTAAPGVPPALRCEVLVTFAEARVHWGGWVLAACWPPMGWGEATWAHSH
mmetsp:Transcript_21489/g.47196  ORF Transcript_21489/g.47196 Transcript_21489/m.47196 type:complete len:204 (-) Transcript_21489:9-620(-)